MEQPTSNHVRPVIYGGSLTEANKLIVCEPCDRDKGRLTLTAWAARLRAAGDPRLRSVGGQLAGLGTAPVPRGRIDWPVAMAESAHAVCTLVHARMAPQRLAAITALRDAQLMERRAVGVPEETIRRSRAHGLGVARVIGSGCPAPFCTVHWTEYFPSARSAGSSAET